MQEYYNNSLPLISNQREQDDCQFHLKQNDQKNVRCHEKDILMKEIAVSSGTIASC